MVFQVAHHAVAPFHEGANPHPLVSQAEGDEKHTFGIDRSYQFLPTGLIFPGSVVAASLLEEGLRGVGAHLFKGEGERFMLRYAPDVGERARGM